MNWHKFWLYTSLIVLSITILLLVTGSPVLTVAFDAGNSIPLGTLFTWAGMISLPFSMYWGIGKFRNPTEPLHKYLATLLKIMIILAALWAPVSYLLAGNLSFSFNEKASFQGGQMAMRWFWRFSYGLPIASIMVLVAHWGFTLFTKKK